MKCICAAWEMKAWTPGARRGWFSCSSKALSEMEGQNEVDHWPKDPGSPTSLKTPEKRSLQQDNGA